jgi:hypothetical protein
MTKAIGQYTNYFKESVANVGVQAGVGALAALVLLINPIAGAIFGVTYSAISTPISFLIDKIFPNNKLADTVKKFAIRFFTCVAIAVILVSLFGFPINFASAVALSIFMSLISIIIKIYLHIKESQKKNEPLTAIYTQML